MSVTFSLGPRLIRVISVLRGSVSNSVTRSDARRSGTVGSGLPPRGAEKTVPPRKVLTISAAAWVIRAPVKHRFGNEAKWPPATKRRRHRSERCGTVLVAAADRAAQGRPDRPAPAPAGTRFSGCGVVNGSGPSAVFVIRVPCVPLCRVIRVIRVSLCRVIRVIRVPLCRVIRVIRVPLCRAIRVIRVPLCRVIRVIRIP
jgi:hypothetical protein